MAVITNPQITGIEDAALLGFKYRIKKSIDLSSATWNTVATHEVFTVTGLVRALLIYRITETCTSSGSGTISFADQANMTSYSAAIPVADMVAGTFFSGATTVSWNEWLAQFAATGAGLSWDRLIEGLDLGYEIGTAAFTNGTIDAYCYWTPISDDGQVVEGAGGGL